MTCRTHGRLSVGQFVPLGFKAKELSLVLFYLVKVTQPYFPSFSKACTSAIFCPELPQQTSPFLLILHRRDNVR